MLVRHRRRRLTTPRDAILAALIMMIFTASLCFATMKVHSYLFTLSTTLFLVVAYDTFPGR